MDRYCSLRGRGLQSPLLAWPDKDAIVLNVLSPQTSNLCQTSPCEVNDSQNSDMVRVSFPLIGVTQRKLLLELAFNTNAAVEALKDLLAFRLDLMKD